MAMRLMAMFGLDGSEDEGSESSDEEDVANGVPTAEVASGTDAVTK